MRMKTILNDFNSFDIIDKFLYIEYDSFFLGQEILPFKSDFEAINILAFGLNSKTMERSFSF